jgi:hypothetical protein
MALAEDRSKSRFSFFRNRRRRNKKTLNLFCGLVYDAFLIVVVAAFRIKTVKVSAGGF